MAKEKDVKTNVMRVLEQKNIPYIAHSYPTDGAIDGVSVATMLGQDTECVFKTLVAKGASGGYYVFDIPVAETLDLKKAAKAVGVYLSSSSGKMVSVAASSGISRRPAIPTAGVNT